MMCNGPGILCITTLLESALFGASRLSVLLGCQTKAWMRAYRETDEAAFLRENRRRRHDDDPRLASRQR